MEDRALEEILGTALARLLGISHRISGCPHPNCKVCQDTHAIIDEAEEAMKHYREWRSQPRAEEKAVKK